MRVAMTGATGYLGAHTARALLAAGHELRLLVPSAEAAAPVIDRLRALGTVTVVVGDLQQEAAELLAGADALVHAAGVVGTDERRAQLMWDINAYATEAILRRAVADGLDPVVSVSSYSALFPSPNGVISPETPTATGRSTYARTKAYADRVARELQAAGAPVVVTYPSSVVGRPFHTAAGVTERGWELIVRRAVAPTLRGGMQMIDVRDVADVHVAAMRPGIGPRRYVCGGALLTFDEMIDSLEEGLARRIRRVPLPTGLFLGVGRVADLIARFAPVPGGLSYEAAMLLSAAVPTDDSATVRELDLTWRSPRAAIVESVRAGAAHAGDQQLGDPVA